LDVATPSAAQTTGVQESESPGVADGETYRRRSEVSVDLAQRGCEVRRAAAAVGMQLAGGGAAGAGPVRVAAPPRRGHGASVTTSSTVTSTTPPVTAEAASRTIAAVSRTGLP